MKAGNHVAGGLVFTGFFASLWNINIFQSVDTLVFASIASLLPDIDHTKSLIGKAFYPLAKWLDRNYGHRTITHSLLFISLLSFISFTIEKYFSDSYTYSTILFFSVFSHYVLDMITVQGIPLFYPFYRNPCVIPGNPSMRISSNDRRAELIAFSLFFLVGLTSIDLFKQGFWTSYNRAFGTLKHLNQENLNTDDLLMCEYNFTRNGKKYEGTGYVIETSTNKAILFDSKVLNLDKNDNTILVNEVKPVHTKYKKEFKEVGFFNVTYDSLQKILDNKVISGQIQSSKQIQFIKDNISQTTNLLKLDYDYNFKFYLVSDSLESNISEQIKINELKLEQNRIKYQLKFDEISKLSEELETIKQKEISTTDLYLKDKYKKQLIDLRKEIETKENNLGIYKEDPLIRYEIEILKKKQQLTEVYFSGLIRYPVLPKHSLEGVIISVIDGDTFILKTSSGQTKVRLYGIDAPEKNQLFGTESTQFLKQYEGQGCKVIYKSKDRYGRVIGELYVNETNICKASLINGFAWHYKHYSNDADYRKSERLARSNKAGLWSYSNNLPPWEHRHNN